MVSVVVIRETIRLMPARGNPFGRIPGEILTGLGCLAVHHGVRRADAGLARVDLGSEAVSEQPPLVLVLRAAVEPVASGHLDRVIGDVPAGIRRSPAGLVQAAHPDPAPDMEA